MLFINLSLSHEYLIRLHHLLFSLSISLSLILLLVTENRPRNFQVGWICNQSEFTCTETSISWIRLRIRVKLSCTSFALYELHFEISLSLFLLTKRLHGIRCTLCIQFCQLIALIIDFLNILPIYDEIHVCPCLLILIEILFWGDKVNYQLIP